MDFEFTPEQLEFVKDVEAFLDEHDDPEIFDVTRENMAQIVDTPRRREFMAELSKKGWLGITWPEEYGGQDGDGVYEYLLNEALAARGGPQIGKGVGIIGKTLITHGSQKLKDEFLPQILNAEIEFARNRERYEFLRWGQKAFSNFRVVPPATGIVHQVNLEYLARVAFEKDGTVYWDTCEKKPLCAS